MLYSDFEAPTLKIGDKVLVTEIGAYSTVSATRFNGFELAPTIIWEEQKEARAQEYELDNTEAV